MGYSMTLILPYCDVLWKRRYLIKKNQILIFNDNFILCSWYFLHLEYPVQPKSSMVVIFHNCGVHWFFGPLVLNFGIFCEYDICHFNNIHSHDNIFLNKKIKTYICFALIKTLPICIQKTGMNIWLWSWKGNRPCADLRYWGYDSVDPSTLIFAAIKS